MRISPFYRCSIPIFLLLATAFWTRAQISDQLIFGNESSESSHQFQSEKSESYIGGLGESARRLLPQNTQYWEGGRISFKMKVDPAQQNYFTVRFWGSDTATGLLILFCDGKQIGYRHLGDIDILDIGSSEPGYNGRSYYRTTPLPKELTQGKNELSLEIRATGPIWGYGTTFEKYQKNMIGPSRALYKAYIHTDGFFTPPDDEKQGESPTNPPIRQFPGSDVFVILKERVNKTIEECLSGKRPLNQMQIELLARAYHIKWTVAYHNHEVIDQVTRSIDQLYVSWLKNPQLGINDPSTPNPDWFGFGPLANALRLLGEPLQPVLDQKVNGEKTRRAVLIEMLRASVDWNRRNRRLYTNQSMIKDLNLYRMNRGLQVLDSSKAWPEGKMLGFLYEAIGLQPWLGSDTDNGPAKNVGENYWQLTTKGLTRELGYVGSYGEVLDWVNQIYEATRPAPGQAGDEKIRLQLGKIARARAVFRYPLLDAEGNRAMRLESIVGWRDVHYPGDVVYGQRPSRDADALQTAVNTLDSDSIGYAQQMIADNQFFASLVYQMEEKGLRNTIGLLDAPDHYETISKLEATTARLPMTPGQPDFVFSDEEDGVIAIKNGDDILYASLYWRARNAINFLARVHYMTPTMDRIAVVREETEFEASEFTYQRPDYINFGFANGGPRFPGALHSSHAGEVLPVAKTPSEISYKPGSENIYAGRGTFYTLRYGRYLIAMNCEKDKPHDLKIATDLKGRTALDLSTRKRITLPETISIPANSTTVFHIDP